MQLVNVRMTCENFERVGNKWLSQGVTTGPVDSSCIDSMLRAQPYLVQMGGRAKNTFRISRRFGRVASTIDVIAADGVTRCKYRFNYGEAFDFDTQQIQCNAVLQ